MISTNSAGHFQWLICQNMEVKKVVSWDLGGVFPYKLTWGQGVIKPHPLDWRQLQPVCALCNSG